VNKNLTFGVRVDHDRSSFDDGRRTSNVAVGGERRTAVVV
jgi:hypothetical protein